SIFPVAPGSPRNPLRQEIAMSTVTTSAPSPSAIPDRFQVVTGPLPASRKVYVPGPRSADLRVAMRDVDLSPSAGEAPVRLYDSSGPYTDTHAAIDIRAGLPGLRAGWIAARGDVEAYDGRTTRPEDNGRRVGDAGGLEAFPRGGRR